MAINPLIVIAFVMAVVVMTFSIIIFHDGAVDVRLMAEANTCEDLKWKLDRQHMKVMENFYTPVIQKVYDERDCETILTPTNELVLEWEP